MYVTGQIEYITVWTISRVLKAWYAYLWDYETTGPCRTIIYMASPHLLPHMRVLAWVIGTFLISTGQAVEPLSMRFPTLCQWNTALRYISVASPLPLLYLSPPSSLPHHWGPHIVGVLALKSPIEWCLYSSLSVALQCKGTLQCDLLSSIARPVSGLRQDTKLSLIPLHNQSVHRLCNGNKLNLASLRLIRHFSKSLHNPGHIAIDPTISLSGEPCPVWRMCIKVKKSEWIRTYCMEHYKHGSFPTLAMPSLSFPSSPQPP
jgi:hypothetical protein